MTKNTKEFYKEDEHLLMHKDKLKDWTDVTNQVVWVETDRDDKIHCGNSVFSRVGLK